MIRAVWPLALMMGCEAEEPKTDTAEEAVTDLDADGYDADTDCDDQDPDVHPGAEETCDGIDNDCNGDVDEDSASNASEWFLDFDGDGYGVPHSSATPSVYSCSQPVGFVGNQTDCDDAEATTHPGADEVCDERDNDCDDDIDEDVITTFYADDDLDGYGDPDDSVEACAAPVGYTDDGTDCDDSTDAAHPGGVEVCDGLDNDCDPATLEDGVISWHTSAGVADMTAVFGAGTPSSPAAVSLVTAGTLYLCGGTWHTTVTLSADVDIVGVGGSAENILDAGGAASVVALRTEKLTASLTGATLQNGDGDGADPLGFGGGGGLDCHANTSTFRLSDVIIQDNVAGSGGGVAIQGCTVEAEAVSVLRNTASYGGGVAIFSGEVTFDDGVISDNEAAVLGGGLHVQGYRFAWAYLDLVDSLISDNHASYGSGMSQYNTSAVTCTGSEAATAGFIRNGRSATSPYSAAIFVTNWNSVDSFTATDCDFGTGGSANAAGDIYHAHDGHTYSGLGADADFVCDDQSCY